MHIKYSTFQIEMLFVLSTLLGCKRKVEIQDKLSHLNIIEWINMYIEYLEWGNVFSDGGRPIFDNDINYTDDTVYHGRGCKCDTDTALKIQYLRFIYTYCCRDNNNFQNKLNLISYKDIEQNLCPNYISLFYYHIFKYYYKYNSKDDVRFNNSFKSFIDASKKYNLFNIFSSDNKDQMMQNLILSQAR